MWDAPYAWVLVLVAVAFVWGAAANAVRFATGGGRPSHAIGMMLYGVLAMVSGWVAWVAMTGPPFP